MTAPDKRPAYEPAEKLLTPPRYDPSMKRPATTVAGAGLVWLRVAAGILWTIELAARWSVTGGNADVSLDRVDLPADMVQAGLVAIVVVVGVVLLVEAGLAALIYLGRNIPRVFVMVIAVLSISAAFVGWWAEGQEINLRTTLPTLALDILILLALSSRSAAAYARRNERR